MYVSKLSFSDETRQKYSKELTTLEKSQLRWNKLKELEREGKLSFIKTRKELALAGGYDEYEVSKGVSWVYRLINNGFITETLLGFNHKTKTPEYEYHLIKEPNYNPGRPRKHSKSDLENRIKTKEKPVSVQSAVTPIKVEFVKDNIVIRLEVTNYKDASDIIKEVIGD